MKTAHIFSFTLLSGILSVCAAFARSPVADSQASDIPLKTELLLESSPREAGKVSGGGIYPTGEVAVINAVASKDFLFVRWEGAQIQNVANPMTQVLCSGGVRIVKAVFEPVSVKVSVNAAPAGMGTVSGAGFFPKGSLPQLIATPRKGCVFDGWDGPVREKDKPQTTLEKPLDGPVSLTARFKQITESLTLSIVCEPAHAGKVKGAGVYARGTKVPISAEPSANFVFSHWKGHDSVSVRGIPATTVFMRDETALQAVFVPKRCYIYAKSEPQNAGRVTGETGVRPCGVPSRLKAEPAEGFVFKAWSGPVADPKSPETTLVPTTGNTIAVSALFEKK